MRAACLITFVAWIGAGGVFAQTTAVLEEFEHPAPSAGWTKQKCSLYGSIFRDALTFQGHEGLSNDFLTANQRFIDAECQGERSLCPISADELKFADLLTVMTMNEGMASTFVPFGCPN